MKKFFVFVSVFFLFTLSSCTDDDNNNANSGNCGNNMIDEGEDCDGDILNNQTCISLGYYGGILHCNAACKFDLNECAAAGTCGDGLLQPDNEECDGNKLDGKTCETAGFNGGTLKCNDDCTLDYSECEATGECGDGTVQTDYEECDGSDLNGASCISLGYHGGFLSCNADCRFDLNECIAVGMCGDGLLQTDYEECDNPDYSEPCPSQYYDGNVTCGNTCMFDYSECEAAGECGDGTVQTDYEECEIITASDTCRDFGYLSPNLPVGCTDCQVEGCSEFYQWGTGYVQACDGDNQKNIYVMEDYNLSIVKFNSRAEQLLTVSLINSGCMPFGNNMTILHNISVSSSGDIYVAGSDYSDANDTVAFACVFSSDGTLISTYSDPLFTGFEEAMSMDSDSSGNIYVFGHTNISDAYSIGGTDLFLRKYSLGTGNVWSRRLGSVSQDEAREMAIDASGNIYIIAEVWASTDGYTYSGAGDAYIAKFNTDGTKLWSYQWGTDSAEHPYGLTTDSSGNIYVAGITSGSFSVNYGSQDAFVSKFSASGTLLWTIQWGGPFNDSAKYVKISPDGYLYVAGDTYDGTDNNFYLRKYTLDGTFVSGRTLGTDSHDSVSGLYIASDGEIYLAGNTNGIFPYNPDVSDNDSFIMKVHE